VASVCYRHNHGPVRWTGNTMLSRYSTWNRKNTSLFSRYCHRLVSSYDKRMFGCNSLMNVKNIFSKQVRPGTPSVRTRIYTMSVQKLINGARQSQEVFIWPLTKAVTP